MIIISTLLYSLSVKTYFPPQSLDMSSICSQKCSSVYRVYLTGLCFTAERREEREERGERRGERGDGRGERRGERGERREEGGGRRGERGERREERGERKADVGRQNVI